MNAPLEEAEKVRRASRREVVPVLEERDGYVRSRWEAQSTASREKRPPRRYYEVTAAGAKALAHSIEHYRTLGGRAAFAAPHAPLPE